MPGYRGQWFLESDQRTSRGARRGQLGQAQGSRWRSPRPPGRRRAGLHGFPLAESLGTKRVRQVDLHASAGRSCFKLWKATPCGADGRVQVVLTVFFHRLGGGEVRRYPPWGHSRSFSRHRPSWLSVKPACVRCSPASCGRQPPGTSTTSPARWKQCPVRCPSSSPSQPRWQPSPPHQF